MVQVSEQEYIRLVQASRRKSGGWVYGLLVLTMVAAFAVLTLDRLGWVPPWAFGPFVEPPQVVFSTPVAPAQQPLARPVAQPAQRHTPFYATPGPVFAGELAQATPTPTWEPTVEGEFWTPEEQTAFSIEATATTEAFYEAIPTAPPEFVSYTLEQCRDPEKVAQSGLLQMWCKP